MVESKNKDAVISIMCNLSIVGGQGYYVCNQLQRFMNCPLANRIKSMWQNLNFNHISHTLASGWQLWVHLGQIQLYFTTSQRKSLIIFGDQELPVKYKTLSSSK